VPLQAPLERAGFLHHFRPITSIDPSQVYDQHQMSIWYNDASYVLCASETEGTPNGLLEGMACGCVPIMTECGNVPEILVNRENGMIVDEPTVPAFLEAITYAREHRERLSAAALESIQSWGYGPPGYRANYFYSLFRALIERGPQGVKPFSYRDVHWSQI
jgi:glycosyltransferase involved in cell wall biosynthesis